MPFKDEILDLEDLCVGLPADGAEDGVEVVGVMDGNRYLTDGVVLADELRLDVSDGRAFLADHGKQLP